MVTVEDMARRRDARAARQKELLARNGGCAVSFTLNIAGSVKVSPLIQQGFALSLRLLFAALRHAGYTPIDVEEIHAPTGCEMLCSVRADALCVKRALFPLEEQDAFGRLMDIDVIGEDGAKIGREALGLPPRRCLLCGQPAAVCGRSRAHSAESLFERAESIIRDRLEKEYASSLAQKAQKALLFEAAVTPKPGLVDRDNPGAHSDMDLFTFLSSAAALRGYFESCVRAGIALQEQAPERTMERLRFLGRFAEDDMLAATENVNTHKGAIYGLGILLGAAGRLHGAPLTAETLLDVAAQIARREKDALPLLARRGENTAGVRQYGHSGFAGARGQAAAGFPLVRACGLPRLHACLAAGMTLNDAAVCALLALMAQADDSNVFKRGGGEAQRWVRRQAAALADQPFSAQAVQAMDRACIERNISPGGSADLTAFTLFAYFIEQGGKI